MCGFPWRAETRGVEGEHARASQSCGKLTHGSREERALQTESKLIESRGQWVSSAQGVTEIGKSRHLPSQGQRRLF